MTRCLTVAAKYDSKQTLKFFNREEKFKMARRSDIEKVLDRLSLEWDYKAPVALSSVNIDDSTWNQVRMTKVDQDYSETLNSAVQRDGAEGFPPFVLAKIDGELRMADGHNRYAAFKANGVKAHDAYVISGADDGQVVRAGVVVNMLNGVRPPLDDRITHALAFVRRGFTITDSAELFSVNERTLGHRQLALKVAEELSASGMSLSKIKSLSQDHLRNLNTVKRPGTRRKLAEQAAHVGMTSYDLSRVVSKLKTATSDSEERQVLKETFDAPASVFRSKRPKNTKAPKNPLAGFTRALGVALGNIPARTVWESSPRAFRDEAAQAAKKLVAKLKMF